MAEAERAPAILVIDGAAAVRAACQRALQPLDFPVTVAGSLRQGREALAAGRYAVVLLGVMLPDGQGSELLEPLLETDPDVVPVMLRGEEPVELALEAIRRGAYDLISIPFTGDMLLLAVNRALEKRALSLETRRLQAIEAEAADRARAQAEAERLLAFKSKFAYTVAHELRAPVAAAESLLRVVRGGLVGEVTAEQAELLGRVERRLESLLALINDLLLLAASRTVREETPLRAVGVQAVLEAVLRRLWPAVVEKGLQVTVTEPEEMVLVRATEEGLEHVLANIISNAFKYTPAGGAIHISVGAGEDEATLTVADSGIGIPAPALAQLGEEFFRAPNAKQSGIGGTGLGLSIVRQHLDHCGGKLEMESEEGVGTTVRLRLRRGAKGE